jgi:hypothetical protein
VLLRVEGGELHVSEAIDLDARGPR